MFKLRFTQFIYSSIWFLRYKSLDTEGASGGDGPWWEQSFAEAEYEWDIAIPIAKTKNTVVVQDTDDIYNVPNKTVYFK